MAVVCVLILYRKEIGTGSVRRLPGLANASDAKVQDQFHLAVCQNGEESINNQAPSLPVTLIVVSCVVCRPSANSPGDAFIYFQSMPEST